MQPKELSYPQLTIRKILPTYFKPTKNKYCSV